MCQLNSPARNALTGFSKTFRDLESDQDFACPGCNLMLQPRDFTADLQAAEKMINDFGRGLEKEFRKR